MITYRSVFLSTGSYLPEKILTNADLEKMVDTSDEWIQQRTGIKQRHIAAENEKTSDMATRAAQDAIEKADIDPETIDIIIVATTSPDRTFPSVAVDVQAQLGLPPRMAFDVQAVCSGFLYALANADGLIRSGQATRVLVIGADKMSSLLDWNDRGTCVLFGDGAGAVILEASTNPNNRQGIFSNHLYANGDQARLLQTNGGPASTGTSGVIEMEGREVFKYAVQYMADVVFETLQFNGVKASDVDLVIPHQANLRIIQKNAEKLGIPMDKVVVTVDKHGNTSAASIPLALDHAVETGRLVRNNLVMFEAMGGGLTWGASLARY